MEIKCIAGLVLAVGLFAASHSACAYVQGGVPSPEPPYANLSDDSLQLALNAAVAGEDSDYCEEISPLLREMARRGSLTRSVERSGAMAGMFCAKDQRQWPDAYSHLLRAEESGWTDAGSLGFGIALYAEKYNDALERLLFLANLDDYTEIMGVYVEDVLFLKSALSGDGAANAKRRMLQGLFDSPHFSQFSPRLQQPIAYDLLAMDADNGRFEGVDGRLAYIKDPMAYINLMADRKFAPIWPVLEGSVGPNMSFVVDSALGESAKLYAETPSSDYALQEYAHALLYAGKFEQVVALVDVEDMAKITEQQGWALNVKAYALDVLGRTAEADDIFDAIARIPYKPETNDWLVSFAINRAYRLTELGRFEEALEANRLAESIPGSGYANMLTLRNSICSLAGLNRLDELKPFVADLYEKWENSYAVAAAAMLCINDIEKAASIVLEALADPEFSGDMATELQRPEFNLFYTRGVLPVLYVALQGRADVREALYKAGRFIPDEYIPEAGRMRMKIHK